MNGRIVYARVQANKLLTCMVKQLNWAVLAEITVLQLKNTSSTFTGKVEAKELKKSFLFNG